jgi:hypothetical protein
VLRAVKFQSVQWAARQYTLVRVDGFSEQGSLLPLHIHSNQEASLRTDLGARATYAYRGWSRGVAGDTAQGISWIQDGIAGWRAAGATIAVPYCLALKAEALYLAHRTSEALEAISEAEAVAERSEERCWSAELHRLRGVFLAAMGADGTQIEASFDEAIRIAKEQKSVSLQKRAEGTYAEYCRQKASGSGGRGFRLPLW